MKQTLFYSVLTSLLALPLLAQNRVIVNPIDPLADFTSLAEWNVDDESEGWITNQMPSVVADGLLSGTTNGGDPQLFDFRFPDTFPVGPQDIVTVEFSLKRTATDLSRIDLFWNDATEDLDRFIGTRRVMLPGPDVPPDGEVNVYQFVIENVNTEFRGLRIDATTQSGTALEFDYIRFAVEEFAPLVDPDQTINFFTSLGDFNTDGEFEGWSGMNIAPTSSANGNLSGLTTSADSQFRNTTLSVDTLAESSDFIEIRLRRDLGDTSRIDLFWIDENPGFSAARRSTVPENALPDDGQFHVIQFPVGEFITGTLTGLRIDPSADLSDSIGVDLDYVRIGSIDPDSDDDGLANSAETNTGEFINSRNSGTNPDGSDTDNDTFRDGDEVTAGTDPNENTDFPAPTLVAYTERLATYLVDAPIIDNVVIINFETSASFSVAPSLPSGLTLNPSTGAISGTPTIETDETTYSVTANFGGGITNEIPVTLTTVNPGIVRYEFIDQAYPTDSEIVINRPVLVGEAPTSYAITPPLPNGLLFDTVSGEITGTPTAITPATDYTITATYPSTPDSTFALTIRTRAIPIYLGRDNSPLSNFVSLGEWDTDGQGDGWTFTNANGTAGGGILIFNSTAADPMMNRAGLIDQSQGTILEIRLKQNDTEGVQIFWADDTGGPAQARQTSIQGTEFINDGLFHTYQINFADVIVGDFDLLRVDPGGISGRTVEIDHIRIGSAAPATAPEVTAFNYDPIFSEIEITWNSTQGADYRIESATDLNQLTWNAITTVTGDADSTTFLGAVISGQFFRIVRED